MSYFNAIIFFQASLGRCLKEQASFTPCHRHYISLYSFQVLKTTKVIGKAVLAP